MKINLFDALELIQDWSRIFHRKTSRSKEAGHGKGHSHWSVSNLQPGTNALPLIEHCHAYNQLYGLVDRKINDWSESLMNPWNNTTSRLKLTTTIAPIPDPWPRQWPKEPPGSHPDPRGLPDGTGQRRHGNLGSPRTQRRLLRRSALERPRETHKFSLRGKILCCSKTLCYSKLFS